MQRMLYYFRRDVFYSTLDTLRLDHGITHSIEWVRSHQDKHYDTRSLPKEVALNIRMDDATKAACHLQQSWLTQELVPVYKLEGCAIYINVSKWCPPCILLLWSTGIWKPPTSTF